MFPVSFTVFGTVSGKFLGSRAMEPIDLEKVATAFRRAIYQAHSNALIGNAPPVVRASYERMTNPRVGDWVAEITTANGRMRHAEATDLDGVGVLEEVAREPIDFGDPEFIWDEAEEGRPHPTETVYYLRTLDGRRFRWHNATVVAAPAPDWPEPEPHTQ